MSSNLNLKVILGSTRQNRFSEKPAAWLYNELQKRPGVDVELLDLRDYPMPFLDDPVSPSMANGKYPDAVVMKWAAKIKEADGFLVVTPEYNHGYSAVLKNAFDHIFPEWHKKAIAFVGYGSTGGARSIEQLRTVAVELELFSTRNSMHIMWGDYMKIREAPSPVDPAVFSGKEKKKEAIFDELSWLSRELKTAREADAKKA